MRWNLIWYVPLVLLVLLFSAANGLSVWNWGRLLLNDWNWLVALSPSAYVWASASAVSVISPLWLVAMIPVLFSACETRTMAYLGSFAVVLVMIASAFFFWFIRWGCFPLDGDAQGLAHIRMLPFIPLPSYPFYPFL